MRRLTYGGAVSLDGFLAGPDEAMDWLLWSDDAAAASEASWQGVDTMLIGRKSYEFALRMSGGKGLPARPGVTSYVFSRTLERLAEGAGAGVELVREDAAAFVRRLKGEPGGDMIVMGGGALGGALIDAGLIDEIGLNVHPLLLGSGVPAFPGVTRRIGLELIEARGMARGCVLMRYRVVH